MNTTTTERYVLSIDLGSSDLKAALVGSRRTHRGQCG